jgi:hypothetical protein
LRTRRRLAVDSGRVDFLPGFRRTAMGYEDIYYRHHLRSFPVSLIFSWAFEITPEGIKLESEIEPNKSIKRRTGRRLLP